MILVPEPGQGRDLPARLGRRLRGDPAWSKRLRFALPLDSSSARDVLPAFVQAFHRNAGIAVGLATLDHFPG